MINELKYNKLEAFRNIFTTAVKSNYAHITRHEFHTLVDIYYDNNAEQVLSKSAFNCPKCKLKEIKKIAKEFFAFENSIGDIKKIKNINNGKY